MTRLPSTLELAVGANGDPLEGAWVQLTLRMKSKNDLALLVGPTDVAGRLVVTADEMERQIKATWEAFPMDYGGLALWDGRIEAFALDREGVRRVLAAVDTWGLGLAVTSKEDAVRLDAYGLWLETHRGQALELRVEDPGGGVQVETPTSRA
jgi:hypothetical protein